MFKIIIIILSIFMLTISISAKIKILTDDPYFKNKIQSGVITTSDDAVISTKSLKVTDTYGVWNVPEWNFPIVQSPQKDNEYRYALFSWKKKGGNTMMLWFTNGRLSYSAGKPVNTLLDINLGPKPNEEWVITVRDLYKDCNNAQCKQSGNTGLFIMENTITGIGLTKWDGEYALLDSVILGTDKNELETIAENARKKYNKTFKSEFIELRQKIAELIDQGEWEKALSEYNSRTASLNLEDKKFFSSDYALINSWLAAEKIGRGDYQGAADLLKKSEDAFKIDNQPNYSFNPHLRNLLERRSPLGRINPDYRQKVGLIVVNGINTDRYKLSGEKGDIRKISVNWGLIKTAIEIFTNGRLSMDIRVRPYDGVYTSLNSQGVPDPLSIKPYPNELLFDIAKECDVFSFYFPLWIGNHGGGGRLTVIPGKVETANRGGMWNGAKTPTPDGFLVFFHEYIHCIEMSWDLKTTHLYRNNPEYTKSPSEIELAFYEKIFKENIPEFMKSKNRPNDWKIFQWGQDHPFKMTKEEFYVKLNGVPVTNWKWKMLDSYSEQSFIALLNSGNLEKSAWNSINPLKEVFNGRRGFAVYKAELPAVKGKNIGFSITSADDNGYVFLNGKKAGEHRGWNESFIVSLQNCWNPNGKNTVYIVVENTAGGGGLTGSAEIYGYDGGTSNSEANVNLTRKIPEIQTGKIDVKMINTIVTEIFSVNQKVKVKWQGTYYSAVILKIENGKYFVHYDGFESSWDEWVTADRMK